MYNQKKKNAVQNFLRTGKSLSEAQRKYNISYATARKWADEAPAKNAPSTSTGTGKRKSKDYFEFEVENVMLAPTLKHLRIQGLQDTTIVDITDTSTQLRVKTDNPIALGVSIGQAYGNVIMS